MGQVSWEADKMLDVYIYDYLVKRNLHATAKSFMAEGKVATDPVAIDAPGGFLFEWWSVFWDIFIARTNEKHSDVAAAYLETLQMKAKEQSKMQPYQQMQQVQRQAAPLQRRDVNRPPLGGIISDANSEGTLGSQVASPSAGKVYSEHVKNPNATVTEALKSTTSHSGVLVQGQSGTIPSALQQIQGQKIQQTTDMKPNSIVPQRSLPMDPSALYGQRPVQGKSGLCGAGLNQGAGSHAFLNGWPLQKLQGEQIRSSFGSQGQSPSLLPGNQYQASSQQQLLGQAHMQVNIGSSHAYAAMDLQKFRGMQRSGFNVKDGPLTGNDGQLGSLMPPSSPMVKSDLEYLLKGQHSPAQRPQELLQQQHQLQQNNRKRKPASSGAANSSGTGNTLGPSNSQPSTPSTSTPGDGVAMGGNLPHASNMPKSSMMYGTDGAGGLGPSENQMDNLEHFGGIGMLDDNVESFLSNAEDARDIYPPSRNSLSEHNAETLRGINEVACNRTSNSKVFCCHFSADGTLLASGGHDKKVLIWNTTTFDTVISPEEHKQSITDIHFRPDSTQLATSSSDRSIQLWNAAESICHLHKFAGHSFPVTSLEFHPKKTDLLCSCDDNGEIWLWNVNQRSGAPFCKGASQKVRFQPRVGQLLAAASERIVSIFDFETKRKIRSLQGHDNEIRCVCWDPSGEYLATVSHDTVKVWSVASGMCTHEQKSTSGNNLHSCVFHPMHSSLLVVGGYQCLQLWNMAENKIMSIHAHDGLISALAQSVRSGYIASASHDKVVKLWK